ncbi:hypothetical protein ACOBV9_06375 [Pseudoalteromonas espejiana]
MEQHQLQHFQQASFAAEEGVDKVERIEVTGSRIKRADLESASPVSIITTEDMKVQGISNISDALQKSNCPIWWLNCCSK